LPRIKEIQIAQDAHFAADGCMVLAKQAAASILAALKQRPSVLTAKTDS